MIVRYEMDNNEKFAQNSNESLGQLVKIYCEGTLASIKNQ